MIYFFLQSRAWKIVTSRQDGLDPHNGQRTNQKTGPDSCAIMRYNRVSQAGRLSTGLWINSQTHK